MSEIWEVYQQLGWRGVKGMRVSSALDIFYLAVLAFGDNAFDEAASFACRAAEMEPKRVYMESAEYLQRVAQEGKMNVYISAESFQQFIRGGGNLHLYRNLSATLESIYAEYDSVEILDIGVGDGLALLPALTESVKKVTLVEPSTAMLQETCAALVDRDLEVVAYNKTIHEFAANSADKFPIAQATFSLHNLPPEERLTYLQWLRQHCDRLLIAEFDVPAPLPMYAPNHVQSIVDRYERGLAEYDNHTGVGQGFLLPVLFGNFDQTMARTTYEQPMATWEEQLGKAGFNHIVQRPLYDYWWSPGVLIDAT